MTLIQIQDIIFNVNHIITIEDYDLRGGCAIRMSNGDKFNLKESKEVILKYIKEELK